MIEVRDLHKTFRVPEHRVDSLKERASRPFTPVDYRDLTALRGVSFDVHEGEFFGIVGRNGSGKSTLLKILASIYRRDGGTVRMAGRVAPFIELGVGFNTELTAHENVVLNGVMMGLSRQEAARRMDAVLDFAELREFGELKLKNYSSGMMVRLAFAVMVQADADIMLIDEVLAVGDASFAQKCMDVFEERRRAGKTIVLVTHDMATVQGLCHRAMLMENGEVVYLGEAEEAAMRYYQLNFGTVEERKTDTGVGVPDVHVRAVEAWLEDEAGERITNLEQGAPLRLHAVVEARKDIEEPIFSVHFLDASGVAVFGFDQRLPDEGPITTGDRVRLSGEVENRLLPGRYFVQLWIARGSSRGMAMQMVRLFDFLVYGTQAGVGSVSLESRVEVVPERRSRV